MWKPATWASLVPTGIGQRKPHHFLDMARVAWANRDELPFAWRILIARRVRRVRARHHGPPRLDDDGHAPVHGAAGAAAAEHRARARSGRLARRGAAPRADIEGAARPGPAAGADGAPRRRTGLPRDWLGRGARHRRRAPSRHRSGACRVLPHVARHHQRVVLRRAEGRARATAAPTSTTPRACAMPHRPWR